MSVVHASALSLVVISLERYHVICQPLQAGYRCTKAKAMVAILVIWVVAFLSAGLVCVVIQNVLLVLLLVVLSCYLVVLLYYAGFQRGFIMLSISIYPVFTSIYVCWLL